MTSTPGPCYQNASMNRCALPRSVLIAGLLLGLGSGASRPALAQEDQRIAPKELPVPPRGPQLVPPAPQAPAPDQQGRVILPALKGLRLIDTVAKLKRNGAAGEGVRLDGLPLLEAPAIRDSLGAYLGKPLTLGRLAEIAQTIVNWYREHDRPFVDVAFPEQDISSGVVQTVVTEFRVGQVTVQGNHWFSSDLLRDQVRLAPGDAISGKSLQSDLDWLNQNPFRQVTIVAEKSATPGDTDLALDTVDRLPLRVYAGYDNTGTPILGHDRWNLGFNWGNAFGLDQQFSYQFTSSDDFWHSREQIPGESSDPTFTAHSVNYVAPLPWRDKLVLFGSYSEAVPRLGPSLGVTGISGQASIRYDMPLPGIPHLTHELQFGYDFKTSNNNLEFGGISVSSVTSEVDQFPLEYAATVTDDFGQTAIDDTFYYSPGNLTDQNKDAIFQAQAGDPFAKAKYVYNHLSVTRATRLPYNMSWVMRVIEQSSDRDLLPSEQLGAGGDDSVRGYDERAANGSRGVLLREELRSPPFSLGKSLLHRDIGDQAQVLAFWDYGTVYQKQNLPGVSTNVMLESVGLGMRYGIGRYFDFRLDYGWQLRLLPGATTRSQMGQLAVTVAY
jgi:hemolysin activation/secretion protein